MGVKTLKEIENILSQEIATILSVDSSKVILDTPDSTFPGIIYQPDELIRI
ncbi:MAG: hypothetical protein JRE47_15745 [Deltaproteobacteria bacterium]|nr:hypothetical protein [Deltaproteobacteria bacterium]